MARSWNAEFQRLCELLALSAVAGTDETGWKVAGRADNAAVFASPDHTILLYGCAKGNATLEKILPPGVFRGVLVSDDHSSYQGLPEMQKCWAHLLRKAIHLVVLYPEHAVYRRFLDDLLALYRQAQHRREDGRLSESGRRRLADEFNNQVRALCAPHCWDRVQPARTAHAKDHERLANEIYRLAELDQLFTFVVYPDVPGTQQCLRTTPPRRSPVAKAGPDQQIRPRLPTLFSHYQRNGVTEKAPRHTDHAGCDPNRQTMARETSQHLLQPTHQSPTCAQTQLLPRLIATRQISEILLQPASTRMDRYELIAVLDSVLIAQSG